MLDLFVVLLTVCNDLAILQRLSFDIAAFPWGSVLDRIFERLLFHILPVTSGSFSLYLTGSYHLDLLLYLDVQYLFVEHKLSIFRLYFTFLVKILPGFFHLL